jgi:cobalt-zinc-cadmium efflux system membrane fusion protein
MKKLLPMLCMMLCLLSCSKSGKTEKTEKETHLTVSGDTVIVPEDSPILSKITLQTAVSKNCSIEYMTTGTVKSLSDCIADISAPFNGRIIRSYVKLGQKVKAGSPLFEISSPEYFETIKSYLQAKQEKELNEKNFNRKKDMFENGVGSKKEFEEAESAYQLSLKESEFAAASIRVFNTDPESVSLEKPMIVYSPINGEVVKTDFTTGQYIKADADPVIKIADLKKVWVVARVKEKNIGMINSENKVQIFTEAYPDKPVVGTVDYIGNIMDEQTRSVEVYVLCENHDNMLKPGMFATVSFVQDIAGAMIVPEKAVLQEENKSYLYARTDKNMFIKKIVTVSSNGEKNLIVHNGIMPGDVIVADGGVYLR